MKTKSSVFGSLLGAALVLSSASAVFAGEVTLNNDGNGGYFINMPASGTDELEIPGNVTTFKLYDDRGPNSNFSLNCDGNLVLVAPENHLIRLNGTMEAVVPAGQYKGMSNGGLILYNSEISQSNMVFDEYGNATIKWLSDGNILILNFKNLYERSPSAGLDLTVSVVSSSDPFLVDIVPVDGGNAVSPETEALQGALVSVTATPAEGYAFDHIEVKDERGNPIVVTGGTWLTSATGSFAMPATNAVVTPVFVAENVGPRVDMPWNGIARYTISGELTVFGVYDYQFSENFECGDFSSPLVLTAPDGYVFKLREEIGGQYYGSSSGFYAFDGDFEDPMGTFATQMSYRGITSGRKLTLVHKPTCDGYGKMGIKLLDASVGHDVVISSSGDGNVGDNMSSVLAGGEIDLTATPADGYMIGQITVNAISDGDWWPVRIIGGAWYAGNDYSFTMPYANVEVSVEFVEKKTTADEGLSIEMPQQDSVVATIPADVESFMVTGSCGWDDACKGTLVLAAPEGSKFQLSGSVEISGENGSMSIFDGSIANALNQQDLTQDQNVELNSSGDTLTLRYQSRDSYVGMNLRVTVFNPNRKYHVTIYNDENGTISADLEEAAAGDTVTLTATPNKGYLLDGFYITYGYGYYNEIPYIGGRWYNNTAKFVMPAMDVNVSAWFEEPDDMNATFLTFIPITDTLRLDIPSTMSFLEIRTEELGDNWEYLNNSDGVLELTAPEGYVIGMKGYICTADRGDVLTIYNGVGDNAEQLLEESNGEIDEIYSAGRSVAIRFKSNASGTEEGLRLYIAILKKPEISVVTIQEFSNGYKSARIDGSYTGDDAVNITADIEVDGFEFVREYTPDAYSTITLPFDYDANNSWGFKEILRFDGVFVEDGKKKVRMKRVWCLDWVDEECSSLDGKLKANTPYVFNAMYSDAGFYGGSVILKKTEDAVARVGDWEFRGTFARTSWQEGDPDLGKVYGFAGGSNGNDVSIGTFVKAAAGAWINPLRAYLIYSPTGNPAPPYAFAASDNGALPAKMDVVIVSSTEKPEDNPSEGTTVIGTINTVTGEFIQNRTYDLKGRMLNGKPKAKGVYVKKRR